MASTPYSQSNASFSALAHQEARSRIYPRFFGVPLTQLSFEDVTGDDTRSRILDGNMGIDRVVRVTADHLAGPLAFTVQERFRRPQYKDFRDITLTEWNRRSNLPSELYKIQADYFLYGYFDAEAKCFVGETVMITMATLKRWLGANRCAYTAGENPRTDQSFLGFTFDELRRIGAIAGRCDWDNQPA